MTQELSKDLMCVILRANIELWIEREKAESLIAMLEQKKDKGFVSINGEFFNIADVVGIFNATTMEDHTRRKNGQWKCSFGEWHNRGEQCAHGYLKSLEKKS